MADWKDTLNLPKTGFPMKANLQATEPQMLAHWDAIDLYRKLRERRRGAPVFILHDGPPYANGNVHLGTALNKVLKDIVVRSRSMMGFDAPYVPGWDCHGLPIELKLLKELGPKKKDMSVGDLRRACREYAARFVDVQRGQFKRLGVLGDWDDPYLTMDYRYQSAIMRALGKFVDQGMVYKGKKPVHWCIHCRTALAEAEVEYENHVSPSIYVEFPLSRESAAELAARVPALAGHEVSALIWTTTPWTIPSNLALAFHPDALYGAYVVEGRAVIVAESLADQLSKELGRPFDRPVATAKGAAFEHLRFRHPLYARDSVGVLADYVTLDTGTGVVHTAPGHGSDDFHTGVRYGLEIYAPVAGDGRFVEERRALRRPDGVRGEPEGRAGALGSGPAVEGGPVRALVPALLALPQPCHLPGHVAVVHRDGRDRAARQGHGRDGKGPVGPVVGRRAHAGHVRDAARLVHLAPALLGRPDSGRDVHRLRNGRADDGAGRAGGGPVRAGGRRGLVRAAHRRLPARRVHLPVVRRNAVRAPRRTSSTCGSIRARATRPCWRSTPSCAGRRISTSRATTSTAGGSRVRCWWAWARAAGPRTTRS